MAILLRISRLIDGLNELTGWVVYWLVLISVLISSGNAVMRYALNMSSNAWLELQWYLFSAIFLLCAGYTLLRNEHVRIDIVTGRFSARTQAWLDVFGTLLFLLPMAILMLWLGWPMFVESWVRGEVSASPGGLIRWPVKLLVPVGFLLLTLQGISELIKRIAFLQGRLDAPVTRTAHAPLETSNGEHA